MSILGWAVLAILAVQEDPASQLLGELDQDDIAAREQGAARLVAAGETTRPLVLNALRQTGNVEVRRRLEGVLGILDAKRRLGEFRGGKIVGDLGAKLSITHLKEEHALDVAYEISNLGTAEKAIYPMLHWGTNLPNHWRSSSRAEGEVEIERLSGPLEVGAGGAIG